MTDETTAAATEPTPRSRITRELPGMLTLALGGGRVVGATITVAQWQGKTGWTVEVAPDGAGSCFGFVSFPPHEPADAAMRSLVDLIERYAARSATAAAADDADPDRPGPARTGTALAPLHLAAD